MKRRKYSVKDLENTAKIIYIREKVIHGQKILDDQVYVEDDNQQISIIDGKFYWNYGCYNWFSVLLPNLSFQEFCILSAKYDKKHFFDRMYPDRWKYAMAQNAKKMERRTRHVKSI